ncbi:Transposable element Tcb1 transposase, partial [Stegodyphus mimosarum]
MANNQSVRRHLDAFTRGRIIGKLEEDGSVTSVAAEFGIADSIVSRLWRQFQTTGTAIRGFSSGRPRGTTSADDRYIALQARRNRRQTAGEIARHTTQATGRPISRFTVARRLHGGGLFARRPVRCVPLTPAHRRRRSLWCREHRNWRDNEWGRVLFTDESRFSLSCDSRHIHIWTERGTRNNPFNIIKRDCFGGRGVLVRADIMLGSRTDLHISQGGSSPGTAIVTRFFFLTCVFSQGLWVLSSSSWTTTLHLIAQLLSKSCWRVKILNTWIGRQVTLFTPDTLPPTLKSQQKIRTICEGLMTLFQGKCSAFGELYSDIVKLNYQALVCKLRDDYNVNNALNVTSNYNENSSTLCSADVNDSPNNAKTNSECISIAQAVHTPNVNVTDNTSQVLTSKPKRLSKKSNKRPLKQSIDADGFTSPKKTARSSKLMKNNIEIPLSNKFNDLPKDVPDSNDNNMDVQIVDIITPKIKPIMAKPLIKYSDFLKKMKQDIGLNFAGKLISHVTSSTDVLAFPFACGFSHSLG